jgi:hypothetical protein
LIGLKFAFFLPFGGPMNGGYRLSGASPASGSSLPFRPSSAISRPFIARLIKGCRVDARADYSREANNPALSTL